MLAVRANGAGGGSKRIFFVGPIKIRFVKELILGIDLTEDRICCLKKDGGGREVSDKRMLSSVTVLSLCQVPFEVIKSISLS